MSLKKTSLFLLIGILILGVAYYKTASGFHNIGGSGAGDIGPGYYPKILALILIGLTIISIFQTIMDKKSEIINLGNIKMVGITLLLTLVYIFIWAKLNFFYIPTFLYLFTLIHIYQPEKSSKKVLIMNLMSTSGVLLGIYLFFDLLLQIDF
ncbi:MULTISPECIES: tripartite tricarboxylate transporter TctB family protein [Neobacillus]|uniref:Tripartite tricarboxylate transporter TctB family protein n=1 Tax=Neobacillus citreus TaxID=2833578 RepID=A0A942YD78_9BACI|nr:tripartite tricarboxylate transporter TctB family protein [Neobacillus citreus]MCH6264234.1 tripartite tricarboxylate transporter TctB family protein [Neobacillus citreus]